MEKSPENGAAIARALVELGFALAESEGKDLERGKDFVQLENGPFDLDLVFTPERRPSGE